MDVVSRRCHLQISEIIGKTISLFSDFRYSQSYTKSKICVAAVGNSTCTLVCMAGEGPTLKRRVARWTRLKRLNSVAWERICSHF
jgi:hypothetical protein